MRARRYDAAAPVPEAATWVVDNRAVVRRYGWSVMMCPLPLQPRMGIEFAALSPHAWSEFMILARSSFPAEEMEAIHEQHPQLTPTPTESGRERQLVLLVDDDPHDREIYGRILCYNGFDVVCAACGSAGIRHARTFSPDIVLLDIGLPDLHGLDLCSSLRTDTETAAIPVVALSAYAETRMGEQARLAGCTRYIEKPASPVAVLHEIEHLVGKAPLPGDGRPPRMTTPD